LPGPSPVRQAALAQGLLDERSLGCSGWEFPSDRVSYDRVDEVRRRPEGVT
jgi:hypothetical protein